MIRYKKGLKMNVLKRIPVPTGDILVLEGANGPIEMVCMGDYGRDVNLNQDKDVKGKYPLLPLTEKMVITISTQAGCSMGCRFCDVPHVGKGVNCTLNDLQQQVITGLHLHPEVTYSNRLNIHYARMGEPTWNPNVLDHARWMKYHIDPEYNVHPVISTMMPKRNEWLKTFVHSWIRIKNRLYNGNAGLQISLNGTNEDERKFMFNGNSLSIPEIAKIFDDTVPYGRKFTLNFPVANWEIDTDVLLRYFNPEHFICKLTPVHKTKTSLSNSIETLGDYTSPKPYKEIAENLRSAGYKTLVFIASEDEDLGMITCGNAILANKSEPRLRDGDLEFIGGSSVGGNGFRKWDSVPDKFQEKIMS